MAQPRLAPGPQLSWARQPLPFCVGRKVPFSLDAVTRWALTRFPDLEFQGGVPDPILQQVGRGAVERGKQNEPRSPALWPPGLRCSMCPARVTTASPQGPNTARQMAAKAHLPGSPQNTAAVKMPTATYPPRPSKAQWGA